MSERLMKVDLVMKKYNIPASLKAQVDFWLDVSVSTRELFEAGYMQELMARLMAAAIRLDADGKLGVGSFGSRAHVHPDATEADVDNYINRVFIPEAGQGSTWMTGTNYAAALKAKLAAANSPQELGSKVLNLAKGLFGKKEKVYPNITWFVSDGQDDGNPNEFERLLAQGADNNYYVLIGVGAERHFKRMKELADKYDHVGFAYFPDLTISDDTLYEHVIAKEALDWLLARQPQ